MASWKYIWPYLQNDKIASQELDHEGVVICSACGPLCVWYVGAHLDCMQCEWHSDCCTKVLYIDP